MSERRNNERRKWGRKVTYPFIDSDGVLVTKNRRRLVDRRVAKTDATEQEAASTKKSVPPTLSDAQPSLDISESKAMELEKALKEDDSPDSIIESSIKELESQILNETKKESTPKTKVDLASSSNGKDSTATSSPSTQPEAKPKPKTKTKPPTKHESLPEIKENDKGVSIELTFKGNKHVFSEKQNTCQLGRDPTCDIVIQGKYASRAHAKIVFKDGKFLLQDNSFNGTYIKFNNGQKIHVTKNEQTLISDGVLSIGQPVKNNANSNIEFKILE